MGYKVNKVTIWRYSEDIQGLKEYVIRSLPEPVYKGEYIEYKMNADSNGNLYLPIGGYSGSGNPRSNSFSWKVSVDGGSGTTYSGTGSPGGAYTLSGYTAGSNHTIKIVPTSETYGRAKAYGWIDTPGRTYLTEIVYDASYMGYAYDETRTGNYFRHHQYHGCDSITKPADEYLPDSVTSIGDYFRSNQYNTCLSLLYSPEESLPDSVTSIGSYFRSNQYYYCSALTEIKGWNDLNIGGNRYRNAQYNLCNSNKTVKVLSNVGYASYTYDTLDNTYVTSVSVPSDYLNNFKLTYNAPRSGIDDSKFIGY